MAVNDLGPFGPQEGRPVPVDWQGTSILSGVVPLVVVGLMIAFALWKPKPTAKPGNPPLSIWIAWVGLSCTLCQYV